MSPVFRLASVGRRVDSRAVQPDFAGAGSILGNGLQLKLPHVSRAVAAGFVMPAAMLYPDLNSDSVDVDDETSHYVISRSTLPGSDSPAQ